MNIKKGDSVIILTGDDKGKTGKVVKSLPRLGKVIVEGVNTVKRHQKTRREGQKGQVVDKAMPIDVSNVRKAEEIKKARTAKVKEKTK